MIRYITSKGSPIRSVEIVDRPKHIQIYIQMNQASSLQDVEEKIAALGFTTLSKATVNGEPIIVATGPRIEPQLIQALSPIAGTLTPKLEKKPFDAWRVRSIFGFSGQILQLASSVLKSKVDGPLLLFASTNLAANTINLVYKGQKRDDPYQLQLLKTEINNLVLPQVPEHTLLPDVHNDRSLLREHVRDNAPHPAHHFMQRYSVNVGELGLRYIGALGMAFPVADWKTALTERRMPMTNRLAPLRTISGLGSIFGKTVAISSKVPDPYNPAPHSKLDELREKYSFLTGGLIEAGAFSVLTYDAITNSAPVMKEGVLDTSRSLKIGNHYHRDWLSAIGGALFVSGYIARSWAKYGERKIDMPEVYAHASDAIATLPKERIPQALADVSAHLANHFKKKTDPGFGEIYNKISDDLCKEHHILILSSESLPVITPEQPNVQVHPTNTVSTKNALHITLQPPPQKEITL